MSQLLEPQTNIISRDKNLPHCATKMVDILLFASVRGNNLIWIKDHKSTDALKSCHCLTSNHLIKIFSEPDWVPSTSEWALTQRHSNLQSGIHEGKLNKYIVEHNFLLKLIIIIWYVRTSQLYLQIISGFMIKAQKLRLLCSAQFAFRCTELIIYFLQIDLEKNKSC